MLNLKCKTCGYTIEVEDNVESCVCEACSNTWPVAELVGYLQTIQDVLANVQNERAEAEKRKKDEEERKKADEERKKQTEAYIARRQADAELERAKSANRTQQGYSGGGGSDAASIEDAIGMFTARNFESAREIASKILARDTSSCSAGFIVAFHDQVVGKREAQLDKFFEKVPTLPGSISAEDLDALCRLFESGRLRLADYEKQVLDLVYSNARELGPAAVCKFVDNFSPVIIASRKDGRFLSDGLADTYMKLAALCSIPKTCFALLGAIETNPESPLKSGDFFLKGRSQRFYDEYVTPVGEIINKMRSEKNRPQFQKAFAEKRQNYRQKAGI